MKNNALAFARVLSQIFNLVLETGVYPECLKVAKVVPIFKSGESWEPSNYRPISTLSVFNKVLEKLLVNRLLEFLNKHNIFYNLQYGFRQGCSTLTAITELMDSLISEIDSKKVVGALFLDLKKAFDTLDHKILLEKLAYYGIRGMANNIIRSYLSNRKQFVTIEGTHSSLKPITVGVPQGSNIGPLLFLLFINDLGKLRLKGTPRLFADDTALFYPNNNSEAIIQDMTDDLKILSKFFNDNLLSLNLSKTKYMLFHSPRKKLTPHNELKLEQIIIEKITCFKYLGLYLDSTISWVDHIKIIEKKVASLCGIMRRVSSFVPYHALLKFYYAFIHSHLNYLVSVWGRACISHLKKLQVLQNRCLKIIFKHPPLYSTLQLYSDSSHNILPLLGLCKMQTLMLVHDFLYNPRMHHNMQFTTGNRLRATRQANHLLYARAFTTLGQKRISFVGPAEFNMLPEEITQINNRSIFKSRLKPYLKLKINTFLI